MKSVPASRASWRFVLIRHVPGIADEKGPPAATLATLPSSDVQFVAGRRVSSRRVVRRRGLAEAMGH